MKTPRNDIRIEILVDRVVLRRALVIGGAVGLVAGAMGLGHVKRAAASTEPQATAAAKLENRVKALEDQVTLKGTYSANATLCGASAASSQGNLGGYAGAKAICSSACGTPTAHMCQIDELVRSRAVGKALTPGWYATGTVDYFGSSLIDCVGYTDASAPLGPSFSIQFGFSYSSCNVSQPVLCCD